MKNLAAITLLLTSVLLPNLSAGQEQSNAERRRMNSRLLDAIETYEACASMSDRDSKYIFLQLCDSSALIYSDLLDDAPGRRIPVSEYVDKLQARQNVAAEIRNVTCDEPFWKDGAWHIVARFAKSLSYNDENSVLFSSREYYRADYDLAVEFVYDRGADLCRIVGIDGSLKSSVEPLPDRFIVISKSSENDERLWCGDSHPVFNSFDQAFAKPGTLRSWHDDVRIKADTLARTAHYDMLSLSYKKKHWRAKVHAALSLGSAFKLSTPVNFSTSTSSAFETGVDIGYAIPVGRSLSIGIYTGIALSSSKLTLEAANMSYSYLTTDSEGRSYRRNYQLDKVSESVEFSDMVVPFYLSFEHKLARNLSLGWNLGGKFYLNNSVKVTPYHITGSVTGDYNGQIVTDAAENALGVIDRDYDRFLYPETYCNSTSMSLLGGLSVNYNILKQNMFVYARFSYEMGIGAVHESDEALYFSEGNSIYPLVYSGRLGEDVATRSFMGCVSFTRQAMWLELGLMFKF